MDILSSYSPYNNKNDTDKFVYNLLNIIKYTLSGSMSRNVVFNIYGKSNVGKSTLMKIISNLTSSVILPYKIINSYNLISTKNKKICIINDDNKSNLSVKYLIDSTCCSSDNISFGLYKNNEYTPTCKFFFITQNKMIDNRVVHIHLTKEQNDIFFLDNVDYEALKKLVY
jgi:ABC-type phosphate transport system ATPase subunit